MCLLSHRVHSIFVLRLFNDSIAMLFLYASIGFMIAGWWRATCICFRWMSKNIVILLNGNKFPVALFESNIKSWCFCQNECTAFCTWSVCYSGFIPWHIQNNRIYHVVCSHSGKLELTILNKNLTEQFCILKLKKSVCFFFELKSDVEKLGVGKIILQSILETFV